MESQNRVQWIYSSIDNNQLAERYDQWAVDYESDLEIGYEWHGPQKTVDTLTSYINKQAKILDAGAGTGLVGNLLYKLGFTNLVAMDLSYGMLKEARTKRVYSEFHQMVMGERLNFTSSTFDAVVSVGVLTVGHAPASSLDELIRITKSGGHIAFSLRPDVHEDSGFKQKQESLVTSGKWELIECTDPFQALPKGEPNVLHQVWIYKVL
jgi:ubiquinone/menaquinone biosynthesis C-methylase UbiE